MTAQNNRLTQTTRAKKSVIPPVSQRELGAIQIFKIFLQSELLSQRIKQRVTTMAFKCLSSTFVVCMPVCLSVFHRSAHAHTTSRTPFTSSLLFILNTAMILI